MSLNISEQYTVDNNRLAAKWKIRIKQAKDHWDKDFKRIEKMRKLAAGDVEQRVNLVHSTIAGMLPHVYARLPEISVQPKESMSRDEYDFLREFSRTLEILLNELLADAKLKRISKTAVRRSLAESVAWAKVLWQQDYEHDPITLNRIQDTQDDISRLESLLSALEEGETLASEEAELERLRIMQQSLENQQQVLIASGLVIDLVRPEDVILDPTIENWEDWDKARWIAHKITLPLETAKAQFPGTTWTVANSSSVDKPLTQTTSHTTAQEQMVVVYEVWDKDTMHVYTVSDQASDYVRDPYQPDVVPENWYPFAPLALNVTDGRFYPLSLTELLEQLQNEYIETRDKYAEHRTNAKPLTAFDKTRVSTEDAQRIVNGEMDEFIPLDGGDQPIEKIVARLPYPPVDPSLYDTSSIRFDVEMMSGLQDAARGAIARAKTAAEAEIMQSGLSSRVTEMQDSIEDWIELITEMGAEMALLAMSHAEVVRYVGQGAVWGMMDREQIYRYVRVGIRAGTSGKPDRMQEQKNWGVLMPQIMELMQSIYAAEAKGSTVLANAMRELLAESLRRMDERFDVDSLLPQLEQQPSQMGV